jgi:uncharacterized protein (DUF1697 family)
MQAAEHVALFRGINVGRAKRVAMADLAKLLVELGYANVRIVQNSGNVVFCCPSRTPAESEALIEEAMVLKLGVGATVTVLEAAHFRQIIEENVLAGIASDPARLMVAVLRKAIERRALEPLLQRDWAPEAFALGERAAYLWCPAGVLASQAAAAMGALLGDSVTSRNWATMRRLHALLDEAGRSA